MKQDEYVGARLDSNAGPPAESPPSQRTTERPL